MLKKHCFFSNGTAYRVIVCVHHLVIIFGYPNPELTRAIGNPSHAFTHCQCNQRKLKLGRWKYCHKVLPSKLYILLVYTYTPQVARLYDLISAKNILQICTLEYLKLTKIFFDFLGFLGLGTYVGQCDVGL